MKAHGNSTFSSLESDGSGGKTPSSSTKQLPFRQFIVFGVCLVLFALSTWLAFSQAPNPDPLKSYDFRTDWRYPLERNAFKRLAQTNADLRDLFFLPGTDKVWAVGVGGVILHSADGGLNWRRQEILLPEKKDSADQPLENTAPVAPGTPRVLSNAQWLWSAGIAYAESKPDTAAEKPVPADANPSVRQDSLKPIDNNLKQAADVRRAALERDTRPVIWFASPDRGWARFNENLYVTTRDGGTTWTPAPQTLPSSAAYFESGSGKGWAYSLSAVSPTLQYTQDSGQHWTFWEYIQEPVLIRLQLVADGRLGWAVGSDGGLYASDSRGRQWHHIALPEGVHARDVFFLDDGRTGWVAAKQGVLLFTDSGGQTWARRQTGTTSDLQAIRFEIDGRRGWAAGDNGILLRSDNGGRSWQRLSSGPAGQWQAAHFLRDGRGWAVAGDGAVWATDNRGGTWRHEQVDTDQQLSDIGFSADDQTGWIVGEKGTLFLSQAPDYLWQKQEPGPWVTAPKIAVADNRLWLIDGGHILRSDDRGRSWQELAHFNDTTLHGICVRLAGRVIWVAGEQGFIAGYEDNRRTWIRQNTATSGTLRAAAFDDQGRFGWAVGDNGVLLFTDTGGARWQPRKSPVSHHLRTVYVAKNGERAWMAGDNGTILTAEAGGDPRVVADMPEPMRQQTHFRHMGFLDDENRGWVAGYGGALAITDNGGLVWDDPAAPYRRRPSPWYYVALLAIAFIMTTAFVKDVALKTPTERSVADVLASDRPLEAGDPDPLAFNAIARGLSRFIRNANTQPPLTLAIKGEWGTGKSSLMNLLRDDLKTFGFRPVWFNAWHHQRESNMLAALLENIQAQATPSIWRPAGWLFRYRLNLIRGWRHWMPLLVVVIVVALMCGYFYRNAPVGLADFEQKTRELVMGHTVYRATDEFLESLAIVLPPKTVRDLKTIGDFDDQAIFLEKVRQTINDPAILKDIKPEQTEKAKTTKSHWEKLLVIIGTWGAALAVLRKWLTTFGVKPSDLIVSVSSRSRTGDTDAQLSFHQRYAKAFANVTQALRPRTMVIFIDDLDRCQPENILKVLEAVNYLVSSGRCFIVLGMDMTWVERCVGLGFERVAAEVIDMPKNHAAGTNPKDNERLQRWAFAKQYLEKLINIEVPIPKLRVDQSDRLMVPKSREPETITWYRKQWNDLAALFLVFRRYLLPTLVLLLLAVSAFWAGHRLNRPEGFGPKVAASGGRIIETQPPQDVPTSAPLPPPGENKDLESAFFKQGETAAVSRQFYIWPLLLLIAAFIVARLRQPDVVVHDSEQFKEALRIWHPVVAAVHLTPRSIKRFMNRLRYFAMRLRQDGQSAPSWWRRLLDRLMKKKPADESDRQQTPDQLKEADLVALAAMYYLSTDLLTDEQVFTSAPTPTVATEFDDVADINVLLRDALARHIAKYRDWPPAPEARKRFINLLTEIRVS